MSDILIHKDGEACSFSHGSLSAVLMQACTLEHKNYDVIYLAAFSHNVL